MNHIEKALQIGAIATISLFLTGTATAIKPFEKKVLTAQNSNFSPPTVPPQRQSLSNYVSRESLYPKADAQLGVGHLRPKDLSFLSGGNWVNSPFIEADWLKSIVLPLYKQPGGGRAFWLVKGWLVRENASGNQTIPWQQRPLSMVQTYYALYSFVVLRSRPDGWFQFRYAEPSRDDDGTAWANTSQLGLGEIALVVEPWEKRLPEIDLLYFRENNTRHALRTLPNSNSNLVVWIGSDHHLEPLEIRGDWMRVKVTQPSNACGRDNVNVRSDRGWIRWRSSDKGPWVWYAPKGC